MPQTRAVQLREDLYLLLAIFLVLPVARNKVVVRLRDVCQPQRGLYFSGPTGVPPGYAAPNPQKRRRPPGRHCRCRAHPGKPPRFAAGAPTPPPTSCTCAATPFPTAASTTSSTPTAWSWLPAPSPGAPSTWRPCPRASARWSSSAPMAASTPAASCSKPYGSGPVAPCGRRAGCCQLMLFTPTVRVSYQRQCSDGNRPDG